ncbi:MAG: response regulator [Verrucomicrobia bacterium]|nr:response regulator [Verrucomicrobiota bacterium]
MEPIAILVSDNMVLLSRMTNDLCQSKYRVSHLRDPSELLAAAREQHPMFVVLDLDLRNRDAVSVLAELKGDAELRHTLVLAFTDASNEPLLEEARAAGADMVTTRDAVASHLSPLVEQLLGV